MLESRAATQRDVNSVDECAGRKDVMFKGKRKVLHLLKSSHGAVHLSLPG